MTNVSNRTHADRRRRSSIAAGRPKAKYGVVTMCVGGGMGAAGLFKINC